MHVNSRKWRLPNAYIGPSAKAQPEDTGPNEYGPNE